MALPPLLCSEFVEFVLKHHRGPTTMIVCSSRERFLEELRASIDRAHSQIPASSHGEQATEDLHLLLNPTLHLISRSQTIRLVFVPTLSHLRAFLAIYAHATRRSVSASDPIRLGSPIPFLAIWAMARLHQLTTEHSAQGISRTLAAVIEASNQHVQKLVLAEPKIVSTADDEANQIGSDVTWHDPWTEALPLLSGALRFGGEERAWSGKTVTLGAVISRWCQFVECDNGGY